VRDVALAALVEHLAVALLEQLHVAGHGPQRFREVVRGDVRELLEVAVGPTERRVLPLEGPVDVLQLGGRLDAVGHVLDAGGEAGDPSGRVPERRHGDGHGDVAPVGSLVPGVEALDLLAGQRQLVRGPQAGRGLLGEQVGGGPAHHVVGGDAVQPLCRGVPARDTTGHVLGEDRVGRDLHHLGEQVALDRRRPAGRRHAGPPASIMDLASSRESPCLLIVTGGGGP